MADWKVLALAGSAALNGVLGWMMLARKDGGLGPDMRATEPRVQPQSRPARAPAPASAKPAASPAAGAPAVTATSCEDALRTERGRVAKLEKLVSPHIRFEAADRGDPSHEGRLSPDIDRVLGGLTHSVECRGLLCKVEIVTRNGEKTD